LLVDKTVVFEEQVFEAGKGDPKEGFGAVGVFVLAVEDDVCVDVEAVDLLIEDVGIFALTDGDAFLA
jgi:hypothetical protein